MKTRLKSILLIDDDEPTNFLTRMILEEAGCAESIHVADSGQSALDYLAKLEQGAAPPDLIFLDINMPAMNGWEFLEQYALLDQHRKGNVVMVMLTTSLHPEDRSKAESLSDVSGFETKPLTAEKLLLILKKYFPHVLDR